MAEKVWAVRKPAEKVETRTYRFLTPVFGGGVEGRGAGKRYDERTPVRVPSIRGQLRFWWRACNPRRITDWKELREVEASIFGSASQPGNVSLTVKSSTSYKKVDIRKAKIAYGAFPLLNEGADTLETFDGTFELHLRYPTDQRAKDVQAALWGWAHFGGYGGRTRRGFGAIEQIERGGLLSIEDGWDQYVGGERVSWPHLDRQRSAVLASCPASSAKTGLDALGELLELYKGIRQKRSGRPYRPEPDTIRRIFQFINHNNPPKMTLVAASAKRFASPLILRPHRHRDGGLELLALALRPGVVGEVRR